ncbi:MAG: hypothetical protein JXJ22_15400 [Bacteroidales bacterium]|nr:hypothetical protein [Bacteroidales bacterium]
MGNFDNKTIQVSPEWSIIDYLGAFKMRLSIGRKNYKVAPGLYKTGDPDKNAEIFVTANYKLSFDVLRKNLKGLDAWILVLDTKGINVWCAAGKGTFGTEELVRQINQQDIKTVVSHKRLILPQLGAPGLAAHIVKAETGFNVKYGPVRASDIKEFIENGKKVTEAMRSVQFNFTDRIILTPVEIMNSLWQLALILVAFFILSGISSSGYSFQSVINQGAIAALVILSSYISGAFLTPALLPWLPSRYFAAKGIVMQTLVFSVLVSGGYLGSQITFLIAWFLMSIALSSYLAMNFTGASTYTSLSGVIKEMKLFIPVQIIAVSVGFILFIISKFI